MKTTYYLHINGNLIYKPHANIDDLLDSDFVVKFWELDTDNRGTAWLMLIEASLLGATESRINQLREIWDIDNRPEEIADFCKYANLDVKFEGGKYEVREGVDGSNLVGVDTDFFKACVDLSMKIADEAIKDGTK